MSGIKRKIVSVLVLAAFFVSIPSVLENFALLNIPTDDVNKTSSESNIYDENIQVITEVNELPKVTDENNPPLIVSSGDIEYNYGETGNVITWVITDDTIDLFGAQYIVTDETDGIEVQLQSGLWYSGYIVSQNVDGLWLGDHIFKITANDGLEGESSDYVTVSILNVAPMISQPDDIMYEFTTEGNIVTWTITDDTIDRDNVYYSVIIEVDGILIEDGKWESGLDIVASIDGLEIGSHNITITAIDGYGGESSDSVLVSVFNVVPIISQPENIEYNYGETGNTIIWTITDNSIDRDNAQYIVIIVDGIIIQTGKWLSGYEIIINVDGLEVGTYTYVITANDGLDGEASSSVTVTVNEINEEPEPPCHHGHGHGHNHGHGHAYGHCHGHGHGHNHGHGHAYGHCHGHGHGYACGHCQRH